MKILMELGSRPFSAAAERTSSTKVRSRAMVGWEVNTASAFLAENLIPAGEDPA